MTVKLEINEATIDSITIDCTIDISYLNSYIYNLLLPSSDFSFIPDNYFI